MLKAKYIFFSVLDERALYSGSALPKKHVFSFLPRARIGLLPIFQKKRLFQEIKKTFFHLFFFVTLIIFFKLIQFFYFFALINYSKKMSNVFLFRRPH